MTSVASGKICIARYEKSKAVEEKRRTDDRGYHLPSLAWYMSFPLGYRRQLRASTVARMRAGSDPWPRSNPAGCCIRLGAGSAWQKFILSPLACFPITPLWIANMLVCPVLSESSHARQACVHPPWPELSSSLKIPHTCPICLSTLPPSQQESRNAEARWRYPCRSHHIARCSPCP